jgi:hypothetical protein
MKTEIIAMLAFPRKMIGDHIPPRDLRARRKLLIKRRRVPRL